MGSPADAIQGDKHPNPPPAPRTTEKRDQPIPLQKVFIVDDIRAIELYTQFRVYYQHQRWLPIVQQPQLAKGRTLAASIIPFTESATDFLRELFNTVNDFRRWVAMLDAWAQVYDSCDVDEQLSLLVEHIRPLAILALGAPQTIRGRIMYAAAVSSGHANAEVHPHDPAVQWDGNGHLTMKVASKIGQPWDGWKALAPVLEQKLAKGNIHDLTDDFRNQREHGHPRNIAFGLTASVQAETNANGRRYWTFGIRDAISIGTVVEQATEQHTVAVEAYNLLCELTREQFEALMDATHPFLQQGPLLVIDGPWKGKKHAYTLGTFEIQETEVVTPLSIKHPGIERTRYSRQKNDGDWVWSVMAPENSGELIKEAHAEILRFYPQDAKPAQCISPTE